MTDVAINNAGTGGTTVVPDTTSTGGPSGVQGGAGAGPVVVPPGSTPSWTDSLPEVQKQYVTSKGFKDPAAVLDSYQNLEKLMGVPKDRLLKLPEKMDEPNALNDIYDRLGRPKTADEYKFETPQGQKGDADFTKWAQGQFHQLGLTKSQGETLAKAWNQYSTTTAETAANNYKSNLTVEDKALRQEWGKAYDQELGNTRKACASFGLKEADVSALETAFGYSKTLKFLASIGSKLGEDSFVSGGGGNNQIQGAMTPASAQAQIVELKSDQTWVAKYLGGDYEAKQKMQRLMEFAYPDMPVEAGF